MAFLHPLRCASTTGANWCGPVAPRGPAPSLHWAAPTHWDAAFTAGDYLYATIEYYPENSTILPTMYLYEVSTRSISLRIPKKNWLLLHTLPAKFNARCPNEGWSCS